MIDAASFSIRVGNRLPYLAYKFGFSLVGALGVTFSMRDSKTSEIVVNRQPAIIANGTYTIGGISTPLTPVDGVVFYPWGATDTAVARKAAVGLFEITWPGNLKESVPSEGYEKITISDSF